MESYLHTRELANVARMAMKCVSLAVHPSNTSENFIGSDSATLLSASAVNFSRHLLTVLVYIETCLMCLEIEWFSHRLNALQATNYQLQAAIQLEYSLFEQEETYTDGSACEK